MGNYEQLKQSVSDVIKTNGNQEITGSILQNVLLTIISSVGANATFSGIATPTTNPGTPDGPVFYLASKAGTYTNFNAIELQDGLSVLMWNGSWSSQQIFSVDNVPTAGSDNLVKSGGVESKMGKANNYVSGFFANSWLQGYLDSSNGSVRNDSISVYCPEYFSVFVGNKYTITNLDGYKITYYFYNDALEYIGCSIWFDTNSTFTPPTNASFVRFSLRKVDKSDIDASTFTFVMNIEGLLPRVQSLETSSSDTFVQVLGFSLSKDAQNNVTISASNGTVIAVSKGITHSLYSITKTITFSDESGYVVFDIIASDIIKKTAETMLSTDIILYSVLSGNRGVFGNPYIYQLIDEVKGRIDENCILLRNNKAVSSTKYIRFTVDFVRGNEYILNFSRSLRWNNLTVSVYDDYKENQVIFSGNINAEEIKTIRFTSSANGNVLVLKDNRNDGAEYDVTLYCTVTNIDGVYKNLHDVIKESHDNSMSLEHVNDALDEISIRTTEETTRIYEKTFDGNDFQQGGIVTGNFPYTNTSADRIALKNCISIEDLSAIVGGEVVSIYCTLSNGRQYGIQQDDMQGSGTTTDSGWKDSGTDVSVSRKFFTVLLRNNDNADITPSDISSITIGIKYKKYTYTVNNMEDQTEAAAARNFMSQKSAVIANHAGTTLSGFEGNTLLSTIQSVENGYDVIENDVRMTSDNVPILYHNNEIVIGGVRYEHIETLTYAQISTFRYSSGQGICKLEDQLKVLKQNNICLINEFKAPDNTDKAVDALWTDERINIVLAMLIKHLGYERFAISAFSEHLNNRIRAFDKKVTLLYITYRASYKPNLDNLAASKGNSWLYLDYGASVDALDKYNYADYIAEAISKNIPIACWTPTVLDCMRIVNDNYTRAIITNTYIDKPSKNVVYTYGSNHVFAQDSPRLTHNGTLDANGFLVLQTGESIVFKTGTLTSGSDIIDFAFEGQLDITSLDHGYGQDTTEYPTGILNPAGTIFDRGTYKYGIQIGKDSVGWSRFGNKDISFTATMETVIYKFDVIESGI